jgi:hypothetical protein
MLQIAACAAMGGALLPCQLPERPQRSLEDLSEWLSFGPKSKEPDAASIYHPCGRCVGHPCVSAALSWCLDPLDGSALLGGHHLIGRKRIGGLVLCDLIDVPARAPELHRLVGRVLRRGGECRERIAG